VTGYAFEPTLTCEQQKIRLNFGFLSLPNGTLAMTPIANELVTHFTRALAPLLLGFTLASSGYLAGCTTVTHTPAMAVSAEAVAGIPVPPALKYNIVIGKVSGGQDTHALWMSKVGNDDFARALHDSLAAANLLATGPNAGQYVLIADLQRLRQPAFGPKLQVTAVVDYSLKERASGETALQTQVVTPYTAGVGDAFLGGERLKVASAGAIRSNIERLIRELAENFEGSPIR